MRYLSFDEIIEINRRTIQEHGGNFIPLNNLLREGAVEYVVDIVRKEVFGQRIFYTVPEIAAAYCFYIVTGHVFQDGNKRTGLAASLIFLELNGYGLLTDPVRIKEEESTIPEEPEEGDVLYQLTIELAAGQLTIEQLKKWFAANTHSKTGKTD